MTHDSPGYTKKTAARTGHRLLRTPAVRDAIQLAAAARSVRTEITADVVLEELYYLLTARLDMFELDDNGAITTRPGVSKRYIGAVSSAKMRRITDYDGKEREASTVVSLFDKARAVSLGLRHLGLLHDKLEVDYRAQFQREMEKASEDYDKELSRLVTRKKKMEN